MTLKVRDIGLCPYPDAMVLMESLHQDVVEGKEPFGFLLFLEHPPTITLGIQERKENLLVSEQQLLENNISLVRTDRGGDITAHEPGQLIIYPILKLSSFHIFPKAFVSLLEQTVIQVCQRFGLEAKTDEINPGVYVRKNKIASIGVRFQNKTTKHGLAFNIHNSLETFRSVIPCGLKTRGVTSLKKEGIIVTIKDVKECFMEIFLTNLQNFFIDKEYGMKKNMSL